MYPITDLPWDSALFKRRIGSISIPVGHVDLERSLARARSEGYELLYLQAEPGTVVPSELLTRYNGRRMPTKVIFERKVQEAQMLQDDAIRSYGSNEPIEALLELSRISGGNSRFKLDPRFSEVEFNALYDTWLRRSIAREIADEVFVHIGTEGIGGFVTVSVNDEVGKVGLLAVSPEFQGRGIGSGLLKAVDRYLQERRASLLLIPTQAENEQAMGFYLKNGFQIHGKEDVYHLL